MLEIFGEQKKVDYQLQIEAAAALSQSEINLIPKSIDDSYQIKDNGWQHFR